MLRRLAGAPKGENDGATVGRPHPKPVLTPDRHADESRAFPEHRKRRRGRRGGGGVNAVPADSTDPAAENAPPAAAATAERVNSPARPVGKQVPLKMPEIVEAEAAEGKSRFTDFALAKEVLAGVQELGFNYCTPVQAGCIPLSLEGRDVTARAQTGTGKTAAFLVSVFTHFLQHPLEPENRRRGACRALVLAPTRELAIQIHKDAEDIGKYCGLKNMVVFGGMKHKEQRQQLDGFVDLLVGTPGRIIDYCSSGSLDLSDVEILVIDEADRMLDMGFIPDVRRIVSRTPRPGERQTMFFSATLTPEIVRLVDSWLVNPATVEIEPDQPVTSLVDQRFYAVSRGEKLALLVWLIRNEQIDRVIVFGNRKDWNMQLTRTLLRHGIDCALLSGDVEQEKRIKILDRFRTGQLKVLVATDVAARGIHVDNVTHVINYDLPEQADDYVHRVGRTARAGAKGTAISFVCEYGGYVLPDIEKMLGHQVKAIPPTDEMVELEKLPPEAFVPDIGREARSGAPRNRPRRSGSGYGGGGGGGGGGRHRR